MSSLLHTAARWTGAVTLTLLISAMYATGFFYTHPAIILAAFAVCVSVMFAPIPLGLAARRNHWLWVYSGCSALLLTSLIGATHFFWNGATDGEWFITDMFSLGSLMVLGPLVALLFFGIAGTSFFAPRSLGG